MDLSVDEAWRGGGGWGEVSNCVKGDRNGPGEQGGALGQEHRAGASPTSRRRREPRVLTSGGWDGRKGWGSLEPAQQKVQIRVWTYIHMWTYSRVWFRRTDEAAFMGRSSHDKIIFQLKVTNG